MRTGTGETKHLGFVRDIYFDELSFQNAMRGTYNHKDNSNRPEMYIQGLNPANNSLNDGKDHTVSNVYFSNVKYEGIGGMTSVPGYDDNGIGGGYPEYDAFSQSVGYAATMRFANNVNFDDTCTFTTEQADVRQALAYHPTDYSADPYHEALMGMYVIGVPAKVVDINTDKSAIGLPDTVTVLREDNKICEVEVASWDGTYDKTKAGAYELTATLMADDEIIDADQMTITTTVYVQDVADYGDVNGDGNVNVTDMMAIKQMILSGNEPTYEQLKAADFNGNGMLDVADILLLKAIILNRG